MKLRVMVWLTWLALISQGCSRGPSTKSGDTSATTPVKLTAVSPVKKSLTRFVEQPGTVRAYQETPLFARLTGYVLTVQGDIGTQVKGPRFDAKGQEIEPGQILAVIAVPEMVEELSQKQALIRQAAAQVEQAKKGMATAEASMAAMAANVQEATVGVKRAKANHDRWESESKRITGLVRSGVIDKQTQDETDNQFRSADAGWEEAQAHVISAEALSRKSRAERDQSEADVKAAEARLDVAKADARRQDAMLQYAKIRAPFDGIITQRNLDVGHYLQPGKLEPLFIVAQDNRVRISVEVPESDAALVTAGAKAIVTIPSLKGPPFESQVSRTAWGLASGSHTLRTEIDLDNPQGKLRPAMYVNARIMTALPETSILPATALMKMGDITVGFRIEAGKAIRTPIQTGMTIDGMTQVLKLQKSGATWADFDGTERFAMPAAMLTDGQTIEVK